MGRCRIARTAALAALLFIPTTIAHADVWCVNKANTSGTEDGTSWATAFTTVQPAVDAAYADGGGSVWVAQGTYAEERNEADGRYGITGAVVLRPDVHLLGGFEGGETSDEMRDWVAHGAVLDGSRAMGGQPALTVVAGAEGAAMDGFTITGGRAHSAALNAGGGLGARGARMEVKHCVFVKNEAEYGGAVWCGPGDLSVTDCVFTDNRSGASGGAILVGGGVFRGSGNLFRDNVGTYAGGAVYALGGGPHVIRGSIFLANRCTNLASGSGGGAIQTLVSLDIENCIFRNNSSPQYGGAVWQRGSHDGERDLIYGSLTLRNCTFVGNRAAQGGALYHGDVILDVRNCILWDNGAKPVAFSEYGWAAESILNTLSQRGFPVDGYHTGFYPEQVENVWDLDPKFVDAASGDLRLKWNSPGRDVGLADGAPADDLDRRARPQGSGIDLGAYEMPVLDLTGDGILNAVDIQTAVNRLLGVGEPPFEADLNGDGATNALDVQFAINAVLGVE